MMRQTTLDNGYCVQLNRVPVYSDGQYLFIAGVVTVVSRTGKIAYSRWSHPMWLAEYNYYKAIERYDHKNNF